MSRTLSAFAVAAVVLVSAAASGQVSNSQPVDAEEVLRVPAVNYRKEWVQLGTFSVLADKPQDGAKELHAVYTERKNLDAYLKDGKFPDGAVFVKDVWNAKTEELTTGTSSFAGELAGRFVMVKDTAGKLGAGARFGDGWGWAFYSGKETVKTVTGNYKVDCLSCHEPARKQGLQFLQGYPLLRK